MRTTQDNRDDTSGFARLTAAILFVLMVGMGYAISPRVEGAVDLPVAAEDQGAEESEYLSSECAADGLVFADCNLEF